MHRAGVYVNNAYETALTRSASPPRDNFAATRLQRGADCASAFVNLAYEAMRDAAALEAGEVVSECTESSSCGDDDDECESLLSLEDDCTDDDEDCEEKDEEPEEKDAVRRINTQTMRETELFYRCDGDTLLCLRNMQRALPPRWFRVHWWLGDTRLREHTRLNSLPYQRAHHQLLWRARDYLVLFGFCGFYVERDPVQWFAAVSAAGVTGEALLPYKLIDLGLDDSELKGHYERRRYANQVVADAELRFRCRSAEQRERYDFFIYKADWGVLYKPLYDVEEDCDSKSELCVFSPYAPLYLERRRVCRAEVFQSDANATATHPQHALQTQLVPEPEVEDVPERILYAVDSLDRAKQVEATRRVNVTTQSARNFMRRFAQHGDNEEAAEEDQEPGANDWRGQWDRYTRDGERRGDGSNALMQRMREFGHPTLMDQLTPPLPPTMRIQRAPPPQVLEDPHKLQLAYEEHVCNLQQWPRLFVKPHAGDHLSKLTPSGLKFARAAKREAWLEHRETMSAMFAELYRRTFGVLDQALFAAQAETQGMTTEKAALLTRVEARLSFEPPPGEEQNVLDPPGDDYRTKKRRRRSS